MMLGLGLSIHNLRSRRSTPDPLAAYDWAARWQTFNPGGTTPVRLFQDVAGTIPAVNDFDPIALAVDANGLEAVQSDGDRQQYLLFENGKPTMVGDGFDDYLETAALGASIAQPTTLFVLAKATATFDTSYVFSGLSFGATQSIQVSGNRAKLFAGGTFDGPLISADTWYVFTAVFNGAASSVRVDEGAAVVGDAGADAIGGFRLLGNPNASAAFWPGSAIFFGLHEGIMADVDQAAVRAILISMKP